MWHGVVGGMKGMSLESVAAISVDMDQLLRLRLVVARVGEMDLAGWWNTKGQLGALGSSVLARGFPRTHRFAQARSVFAVAAHRCVQTYETKNAVTLWRLPAEVEDEFDMRWEQWLDAPDDWRPVFRELETCTADLVAELRRFDLATETLIERASRLRRSAEQRAVAITGEFTGSDDDLVMLALGFSRGAHSNLAVPYQPWSGGS